MLFTLDPSSWLRTEAWIADSTGTSYLFRHHASSFLSSNRVLRSGLRSCSRSKAIYDIARYDLWIPRCVHVVMRWTCLVWWFMILMKKMPRCLATGFWNYFPVQSEELTMIRASWHGLGCWVYVFQADGIARKPAIWHTRAQPVEYRGSKTSWMQYQLFGWIYIERSIHQSPS